MTGDSAQEDSGVSRPILSVAYARFLLALPFVFLGLLFEEIGRMLGFLAERIAGGWPDE